MQVELKGLILRKWQSETITRWQEHDRRGIVEAVTGTGKTAVGLAAVADGLGRGRRALIVVPSAGLMAQWTNAARKALPTARIGQRGDRRQDSLADVDVLVAIVNSAISMAFPPEGDLLLVADEVHRYGAESFAQILSDRFGERIGLTATLERSDDGVDAKITPYFENLLGGCDFARAKTESIIAPIRVLTVSVQFTPRERSEYQELDSTLRKERFILIDRFGCREEPFGAFLADVQALSEHGEFAAMKSAKRYLSAFSGRKALLATSKQKLEILGKIGGVLALGGRTIVFSETKDSCHAAARELVGRGVEAKAFTSDLGRDERTALLTSFAQGEVAALAAPRVLDEGIDVPEADLAVIMASSRSRRQMIQRMGRVVRPKADGRAATFVVLYMQGSIEDPARGAHEDFLSHLLDVADVIVDQPSAEAVSTLAGWIGVSPEQVRETQRAPRVAALRALNDGFDVHTPVKVGDAATVLRAMASRGDVPLTDRALAVLSVLTVRQLRVLATRFGLGGAPPRSVRDTARSLDLAPEAIVRIEDEALTRLTHPDTAEVLAELAELVARRHRGRSTDHAVAGSHPSRNR
ncbi:DEAD/DEAH box helicase family protein [Gordonia phosphorivorans]|uniref:DEAD/DEAH box helicase family protein n=1 Tax=Gordonia phosphorivorans TaxID=1056982 RepID=A0ABV6H8B1_9ACTN